VSVREIRVLGDPALREPGQAVEVIDDEVRQLVDDMIETMHAYDGIGLAAPQVGVPLRVFVYDVREPEVESGALINPEVIESVGRVKESEGCLSIPELTEVVERAADVVVRGLTREGEEVTIEASGLLSRCFQHEIDHLDGVLFIDRVSPLKRRLLLSRWAKMDEAERRPAPAV
jgi:peptide deformylase